MLKCCVNGARAAGEHPALPVTAQAVGAAAAAAVRAGAAAVHAHVKDTAGADTLDAAATRSVVEAVRAAAPGAPLGLTTGAWAEPDGVRRAAAVARWPVPPDFASVNWHEPGAEQVADALLAAGIGVEAGLWHADAVAAWLRWPGADRHVTGDTRRT